MSKLALIEKEYLKEVPEFRAGDEVKISLKVLEEAGAAKTITGRRAKKTRPQVLTSDSI